MLANSSTDSASASEVPPRASGTQPRASQKQRNRSRRTIVLALGLDAVLVVAFAAFGRVSHYGGVFGEYGLGLATTAWPFLAALALAWFVTLAWRAPFAPLRTGVPIWVVTVVGGMLLRALSGQGTALPFIIVATLTLLLLLVGWRLIGMLVRRLRRRASAAVRPKH
ncbi:MAG TPA: DUF3054 domain-containing protein [Candidatus Agrococcus pullicola]|uniref:DUF3054 domain-containing protein n=1 Tax=Candidatus Agrococcus pullicola TaxID=2838429 RepID=A0A9D1Z0X7_9MICO|nr:DUF3054 domain-containing protein [Candidatus Agrococcus pullicola]